MSKNPEYIEHLAYKFNNGSITPDELETLFEWYNNHDDYQVTIPTQKSESYEAVKSRMLSGLMHKISESEAKPVKSYPWFRWTSAAAAVLIAMLITWQLSTPKKLPQNTGYVKNSIEPGGYKATLTLSDGKTVALSSSQTGIITGEKITYTNGDPVNHTDISPGGNGQDMLALQTPRGGTYKLILPDGTEVWLNAASKLKYPSSFSSGTRIVQLEGEAYFHVKTAYRKNGEKVPFLVRTRQQEVEVLGTQFNINAYPGQTAVKTTLAEGKVSVSSEPGDHIVMQPGQQAITTLGKTRLKHVNVYNYTAWREGKFSFDGKTFEETMDEIARWYDLQVVYESKPAGEELTGDAFRNENIHLVLRVLKAAEIDYKLDAARRLLTIKGKKNRI